MGSGIRLGRVRIMKFEIGREKWAGGEAGRGGEGEKAWHERETETETKRGR